VFIDRLD